MTNQTGKLSALLSAAQEYAVSLSCTTKVQLIGKGRQHCCPTGLSHWHCCSSESFHQKTDLLSGDTLGCASRVKLLVISSSISASVITNTENKNKKIYQPY